MNNTEEIIERVDSYLNMMRYKYSSQEKLARLNILHDYYNSLEKDVAEEVFSSDIEVAEQLSSDLKLPVKVKGVFLYEGRPFKKWYTAEEIEKSVSNPLNQKFPLMLDHRDKEAGKVVGQVTKIKYDASIKGLRWWGHINDETFARNVIDESITEVSATIFSVAEYDHNLGLVGKNLTYKELSLVMTGRVSGNYVEVDD